MPIVAVYNSAGTKVATYNYTDAWGNHTVSYTDGGASTGAQYNPFRYRSYYYDTDLGMYYLQSRYYDPNTCRFINADSVLYSTMLGYNMFAYCESNPVTRIDPTGRFWFCEDIDLDEDDLSERGGGGNGFGPGTSYYNFKVRASTAAYDANRGGYHYSGVSHIGGYTSQFVTGPISVTDDMATSSNTKYTPPKGGGGTTSKITISGIEVDFGHGGRHLSSSNLSISAVERAIARDVVTRPAVYKNIGKVIINIKGYQIEYHYRTLSGGWINVGTYFVSK